MIRFQIVVVHRTALVKINGILYKCSSEFVLCKILDLDLAEPTFIFGCIEEIIITSSTYVVYIVSFSRLIILMILSFPFVKAEITAYYCAT